MLAKFYEIPSLPFQDIEPKRRRRTDKRTDERTDRQRENSIPPHKHSLQGGIINHLLAQLSQMLISDLIV